MTYEEAMERADRIVSLDLPKDQLIIELAREFGRIALEAGWQKEELRHCQELLAMRIALYKNLEGIMAAVLKQTERR